MTNDTKNTSSNLAKVAQGFTQVPNAILRDHQLSPVSRLVAAYLAGIDCSQSISVGYIKKVLGLSNGEWRKARDQLIAARLFSQHKHQDPSTGSIEWHFKWFTAIHHFPKHGLAANDDAISGITDDISILTNINNEREGTHALTLNDGENHPLIEAAANHGITVNLFMAQAWENSGKTVTDVNIACQISHKYKRGSTVSANYLDKVINDSNRKNRLTLESNNRSIGDFQKAATGIEAFIHRHNGAVQSEK